MSTAYKKVYYDPKHPASFGSVQDLAKATGTSVKETISWLQTQDTYTLHKPIRKRFPRNRILVSGIDDQWEADLIDVQTIQSKNNSYKYILTVIDSLSKYAWAIPLKDKSADSMVKAFNSIFKERIPRKIRTDRGKEFLCQKLQKLFKEKRIIFFTSNNETKAAIVERFNRTLRTKLWKYFTTKNSQRYLEVLPKIVYSYNHRVHSSIGIAPIRVDAYNAESVWRKLYQYPFKRKYKKACLKEGDLVRISKAKNIFEQGYKSNWTKEIFVVKRVLKKNLPEYKLHDLKGEEIIGTFLDIELQRVTISTPSVNRTQTKQSENKSEGHHLERAQRASKIKGRKRIHEWING